MAKRGHSVNDLVPDPACPKCGMRNMVFDGDETGRIQRKYEMEHIETWHCVKCGLLVDLRVRQA